MKNTQKKPRIYITNEQFESMNFKEIVDFPTYYASYKGGNIAHKMTNGKIFLMRTGLSNVLYRQVCLRKPNDPKPYVMSVGHAVALAWCEGRDEEHNEVGHIKENGRMGLQSADDAENLEWVSRKQNCNTPLLVEKRRQITLEWWSKPKWAAKQKVLIKEGQRKRKEQMEYLLEHPLF